jgi:hypothetical protein
MESDLRLVNANLFSRESLHDLSILQPTSLRVLDSSAERAHCGAYDVLSTPTVLILRASAFLPARLIPQSPPLPMVTFLPSVHLPSVRLVRPVPGAIGAVVFLFAVNGRLW